MKLTKHERLVLWLIALLLTLAASLYFPQRVFWQALVDKNLSEYEQYHLLIEREFHGSFCESAMEVTK